MSDPGTRYADKRQQDEDDPMVKIRNRVGKASSGKVTDHRHKSLEHTKPQTA